ncbi:Type III restriction enzyme, res subunit [Musa troglodytarum]|uniref:Type III restriction enzyme, res subunit n=1 Tax=Musa troglodytarum TaxID=320322 RepID=A0A9E7K4M3_9LILI|nr:Type III restriction enzyme, res subunit [Musa troglodytarum]
MAGVEIQRQQRGRMTISCGTCLPPRANWRPRHTHLARLLLCLPMSTDRPSCSSHRLSPPKPLENPPRISPLPHLLPTLLLHRSHGDCSGLFDSRPKISSHEVLGYEIKVFEAAMRKNTIAVLETGAGKTLIAVMLMKEFGKRLTVDGKKMMIIFLAQTLHLVNQIYEVTQDYTELDEVEYSGSQGIGEWSTDCWEKNVKTRDPSSILLSLERCIVAVPTV